MNKIIFIPISGKILSGKSVIVKSLIDFFLNKHEIQLYGYSQPSHFEEGDRNGYNLILIQNDRTLEEFQFARLKKRSCPGQIPYLFEDEVFKKVFNTANSLQDNGNPTLLFFDEIGRLELSGKGHYDAIAKFFEKLNKTQKLFIIVTFNERRKDEVFEFLKKFNAIESDYNIKVTDEETNPSKYAEEIFNIIQHA